MSLDQGMRFGGSDYHRGFGDNMGFGGHQNSYQNENFQNNLNQLLNGPQTTSKFCSDTLGSQISSHYALQSLLNMDSPEQSFPHYSLDQTSNYSSAFQPPFGEFQQQQDSFSSQQQNTFSSQWRGENAFSSQPQNTFSIKQENAFSSQPQNSFSSQQQNSFSSQLNSFSSQPQNTFPSQQQNTFCSQPQNTFSSQPQNTFSSQAQNTVSSQAQNTFSSQAPNTFSSQAPNTFSSRPQNTFSSQVQSTFSSKQENTFSGQQQNSFPSQQQHHTPSLTTQFPDSGSLFSRDQFGLGSLAHFTDPATSTSSQFNNFSRAPGTSPQETSVLGLSDISSRLEASRISFSQPRPAPSSLPSDTSVSSRSRNSTPLSWNPLGQLSGTPLSSVTPSPTLMTKQTKVPSNTEAEFVFYSDDEQDPQDPHSKQHKTPKKKVVPAKPQTRQQVAPTTSSAQQTAIRGIQALTVTSSQTSEQAPVSSWSQVVRTSSSRLPGLAPAPAPSSPSPPPAKVCEQTFTTASQTNGASHSGPALNTTNPTTLDFHRGPKVDPRWPVAQQVFLGPIPMSISWDEIRNVFYTKVSRRELLHFYVQSKPVNEVVYGQVVFDKAALANKMLKEGPVKVRGVCINVTSMREKVRADKIKK